MSNRVRGSATGGVRRARDTLCTAPRPVPLCLSTAKAVQTGPRGSALSRGPSAVTASRAGGRPTRESVVEPSRSAKHIARAALSSDRTAGGEPTPAPVTSLGTPPTHESGHAPCAHANRHSHMTIKLKSTSNIPNTQITKIGYSFTKIL